MSTEPLTGAGAEHAQEIAERAVLRFARLLEEELGNKPASPDTSGAGEVYRALLEAMRRFAAGEGL